MGSGSHRPSLWSRSAHARVWSWTVVPHHRTMGSSHLLGLPHWRRTDCVWPRNPLRRLSACGGMVRSEHGEPLHTACLVAHCRLQAYRPRCLDGLLHFLDHRRSSVGCGATSEYTY